MRIYGTVMPGAVIEDDSVLVGRGTVVEPDVIIGARCRIQAMCYITNGVTLHENVFVGPGTVFTNDPDLGRRPMVPNLRTVVDADAAIGANVTVLPGVRIGRGATVGAGSVVTHDVPAGETWWGNPARRQR